MLRGDDSAGAAYYAAFVTPGHGIAVQWRLSSGASSNQLVVPGAVPAYLRVIRTGTSFSAYTSPDGTTWTLIPGSTVSIVSLSGAILGGMAVSSHNDAQVSSVAMADVSAG